MFCVLQACSGEPTVTSSGQIFIHVVTRGTYVDTDGYTLIVDGDSSRVVTTTAALTLTGIAPGQHELGLKGLAPNCTLGASSYKALVAAGKTTEVSFIVDCVDPTGRLVVRTVTSGADDDPDGYTVHITTVGYYPAKIMDEVIFPSVLVGDVTVSLDGLAFNCAVQNQSVQTAHVSFASTVVVEFFVKCLAKVGTIVVKTVTTGSHFDSDGYVIDFRDSDQRLLSANDATTYAGFRIDGSLPYFSIRGIAQNCTVAAPKNRTVQPVFQATVFVEYAIACVATVGPYSTLAFQKNGPGGVNRTWTIRSDGQEPQRLGSDALPLFDPVWSPDGSRIAATAAGQIYVMDADGGNPHRLTTNGGFSPAWSPDGTKLLFLGPTYPCCSIFTMNADGSNQLQLTQGTGFADPSFSPNGLRILFLSNCGFASCRIMDMKVDGTDVRILSDVLNEDNPSYNANGSKILFGSDRSGAPHMYEMDADGSNVRMLEFLGSTKWATYSPDDSRIAYSYPADNGMEIFIVNADGTAPVRVTSDAGFNFFPRWKP